MQIAKVFRTDEGLMVRLPDGFVLAEGEIGVEQDGDGVRLLPANQDWVDKIAIGIDEDFRRYANEKPQWPDPVRDSLG